MKRNEILDEAKKIICGDRDQQYGTPENSFATIAALWSDYLGKQIDAKDAAIMMSLFKIARIKTGVQKDDSYIDAVGYIACAAEIASENKEETETFEDDQKNDVRFPIKDTKGETCARCVWHNTHKCHDHLLCKTCPNYKQNYCRCSSISFGDECPYFEEWHGANDQ